MSNIGWGSTLITPDERQSNPIGKHALIQRKTSDNVMLSDVFRWISACFPIGNMRFSSSVILGLAISNQNDGCTPQRHLIVLF